MPRPSLSVQLYSLRNDIERLGMAPVLKMLAGFGYAGVEFAGYKGIQPKELRKVLDGCGLRASSTHGAIPDQNNLAAIVTDAQALGLTYHISGPGFQREVDSKDTVLRAAEKLQAGAALLAREGLRLGIHNHEYEFDRVFAGQTPHAILREQVPDAVFEIDTYWVTVGGGNPCEVIASLGARAPILHIKDGPLVREAGMTAVGQGKMDWKSIFAAAHPVALEWVAVELDRCDTDMAEAIRSSAVYLMSNGYAMGKRQTGTPISRTEGAAS